MSRFIPVDICARIRYDLYMIRMSDAIEEALGAFVERHTGVRPVFKPSKKAHLASSAFLRADAEAIAETLDLHAPDCRLLSAPLLSRVSAENGWLLFFFTAQAVDAFAKTLPDPVEPDETFFLRRLWIMAHHKDAETPDDPALLDGFFAALFAAPQGEERFLSAPKTHDGAERIAIEQRLFRTAKILLWERRNTVWNGPGSDTRPF